MAGGKRPSSVLTLGDENNPLRTINACVYAHQGAGKTVFAGSGANTFIMDSDHGTQSAEAQGSKASVMPVYDFDQVEEAYDYMANGKHDYKWVWWDTLTLFQDRALIDDVLIDAHIANPRQDENVASQREYLVTQNRIGRYIRQFCALPINFGFTCHAMTYETPAGNRLYIPALQGGKNGEFSNKITAYTNVIGYLGFAESTVNGKKTSVQRMLFRATNECLAKDKFNALGSYMDKPTVPKLEAAIAASRRKKA